MKSISQISKTAIAIGALMLGAVGGSMFSSMLASAATPTATTTAPSAAPAGPSGTFKSNEDPTHEAGESAAREAQEDAGQRPAVQ